MSKLIFFFQIKFFLLRICVFVSTSVLSGNPYWWGRLSTVDLLVLSCLDQLIFSLKIVLTFVTKQASLMRWSAVPSLPLRWAFLGCVLILCLSQDFFRPLHRMCRFKVPGLTACSRRRDIQLIDTPQNDTLRDRLRPNNRQNSKFKIAAQFYTFAQNAIVPNVIVSKVAAPPVGLCTVGFVWVTAQAPPKILPLK